ncbi:MAG: type III-B CRISPR module RAMP protein Cmr6 [Bacteroidota bacterium]
MGTANIGWLFYRDYFQGLEQRDGLDYSVKSERIARQGLPTEQRATLEVAHTFELKTTYPGLILGSGYQHETGGDGEFKIGFFFDYTTGLPQVPGSSVKGLLRSAFPFHTKDLGESFRKPRIAFIQDLIKTIAGVTVSELAVQQLEEEIFAGIDHTGEKPDKMSMYQRDTCYDACISGLNYGAGNRPIMASDYVTPHKQPLDNPIPLMFLKVRPEVIFKFHFALKDSKVIPELTATHKLQLFKEIILAFGIGAKTNVGYGQFTSDLTIKDTIIASPDTSEPETLVVRKPKRQFEATIPQEAWKALKSGKQFNGEILEINDEYVLVGFKPGKKQCIIRKNYKTIRKTDKTRVASIEELDEGDEVTININRDYQPGTDLNCSVKLKNK